jgi:apolipoprotein N-acyltransferase
LQPSGRRALAVALAWVGVLGTGLVLGRIDFTRPTSTLAVSLLQGNVPQNEKFERRFLPEQLAWVQARLADARGTLVVGPETVIPLLPWQLEPGWWRDATAPFREGPRGLLVGLPLGSPEAGYTNSVAGVSAATSGLPDGRYRYDKHHLVPFGEFIPTGFKWFTRMMNIPLGDFARGPLVAPSFRLAGERIAPNVCYEDLFGEELAARFAGAGDRPTILANMTNIGWFGRTVALDQHLHISRLRTLELQRPMLRATNTGTTAVIDHRGTVTASLPVHTQGVLEARVEGREGTTPFAWWAGRFALWPLVALAMAVLAVVGRDPKSRIARR